MEVKVKGKIYNFEVTGTVGLVYYAERLLPEGERLNLDTPYHICVLYYAALAICNREPPTLQDFIGSLTSPVMRNIGEYFWEAWQRLEGQPQETKGEEQDPKNG